MVAARCSSGAGRTTHLPQLGRANSDGDTPFNRLAGAEPAAHPSIAILKGTFLLQPPDAGRGTYLQTACPAGPSPHGDSRAPSADWLTQTRAAAGARSGPSGRFCAPLSPLPRRAKGCAGSPAPPHGPAPRLTARPAGPRAPWRYLLKRALPRDSGLLPRQPGVFLQRMAGKEHPKGRFCRVPGHTRLWKHTHTFHPALGTVWGQWLGSGALPAQTRSIHQAPPRPGHWSHGYFSGNII